MTTATTHTTDELRVTGVTKRFTPRNGPPVVALSEVDLTVQQGRFVTLFGPSGCGKSTLLRLVAGLESCDEGTVTLFGDSPALASAHKNISWVPQSSALLPWATIRENCRLSAKVNRAADRLPHPDRVPLDADEILAELGLAEFADALPAHLSGGMRQRASIARGFTQGAPLLLMDEPFSALDEFTRESARAKLLHLWDRYRKTVLFVTHSAAEAVLLSDEVVVMTPRPGRISAVVPIDLPRPRGPHTADEPRFTELVAEVKSALRAGWKDEA
ncbi:MAG: ABC transporter ATP-binding protein [Actinobacteria bacterium]|nr:ABC transporter ATP-binding protein [Actinomycetota bacterium]MCG2798950.1 ABC transporter ATP-binding protein [Cellulomonas sp.]